MAKSIRSKWKRKCRAIKRERYAVKELARLKKMLGIKEDEKNTTESEVMETSSDQVIFLDAGQVKEKSKKRSKKMLPEESDVEMSSDDEKVKIIGENGQTRVFSTKTFKDQNGQYPVWLHKRKIAKLNNVGKKNKKRKMKIKKGKRS